MTTCSTCAAFAPPTVRARCCGMSLRHQARRGGDDSSPHGVGKTTCENDHGPTPCRGRLYLLNGDDVTG